MSDIRITKKESDPDGILRVSIGGAQSMGYYLTYRGPKEEVIEALEAALKAIRAMAEYLGPDVEPDVMPDDGKKYA